MCICCFSGCTKRLLGNAALSQRSTPTSVKGVATKDPSHGSRKIARRFRVLEEYEVSIQDRAILRMDIGFCIEIIVWPD